VGQLTILGLVPQQGAIGTRVTIQGLGFTAIPAGNAVGFNGVSAVVISATANSLVVQVPVGATTGLVTLAVGTSLATSPAPFTVLVLPSITSVSPPLARLGSTGAGRQSASR
jgi:hypothetical protein